MRRVISLLMAVPVLGAALLTSAQAQVPPDFEPRELERSDMEFVKAARPFADCLVAENAREIPKFLGALSHNSEWLARDMAKGHPACPRPKSIDRNAVFFLQSAILEALIGRDFGNTDAPANFNHLPPLLYVKDTDSALSKELFANLIEPYDCVSRREPAKVRAFLGTRPLSVEEGASFANLKSILVACHPKGEMWELRPYFARRYLAETFYSLMKVDQRAKAGVQ